MKILDNTRVLGRCPKSENNGHTCSQLKNTAINMSLETSISEHKVQEGQNCILQTFESGSLKLPALPRKKIGIGNI